MSDLVAWLREQVDVDEAAAKAALDAAPLPWHLHYDEHGDDRWLDIDANDGTSVIETESGANGPPIEVAEHIAAYDPARVLAEVEFKRKLLADYENDVTWSMDTLRDLARTVYRDRPGYDEAVKA